MNKIIITTDNKWNYFKTRDEVPAKVLKREFDYLDDESWDGYIKYKNFWYHTSQFLRIEHGYDSNMKAWDGYHSDSMSTGVLIKVSNDMDSKLFQSPFNEKYKIAVYRTTY